MTLEMSTGMIMSLHQSKDLFEEKNVVNTENAQKFALEDDLPDEPAPSSHGHVQHDIGKTTTITFNVSVRQASLYNFLNGKVHVVKAVNSSVDSVERLSSCAVLRKTRINWLDKLQEEVRRNT